MDSNGTVKRTISSNVTTWLFNPFHFVAGGQALVIGLAVILASGVLAYTGYQRFDGLLDIHATGYRREAFWLFITDGLIAWLIISSLITVAAKLVSSSRARLIDIWGTQALARWPMLLIVLIVQPEAVRETMKIILLKLQGGAFSVAEILLSIGLNMVLIVPIIWTVALMYRAFAVSCNARGSKAVITFIGIVIAGELLSKIAWYFLTPLAR
jgi:hypothetical protein